MPAISRLTRRRLLTAGAAAAALPALCALPARAAPPVPEDIDDPDDALDPDLDLDLDLDLYGHSAAPDRVLQVDLPQLRYPGAWQPRPGVMRELARELRLRTRLEPQREPSIVTADSPHLFATPFLYIAGQGGLPALGEPAERQLARFLDHGGTILFDGADGGVDLTFERDVRALLARLIPGAELARVGEGHVLYRSFYVERVPLGRTATFDHVLGIESEGRLRVILARNDLGGALARDPGGLPIHPCVPGGPDQRERAIRFAVNILLYATCTDYKADRAHVETLLQHRRRR